MLFAGTRRAECGIGLDAGFSALHDGNILRTAEPAPDLVWTPEAEAFYAAETESAEFRAGYKGSLFLFRDNTDRNFGLHGAFGSAAFSLSRDGPVATVEVESGARVNRDDLAETAFRCNSAAAALRFGLPGRAALTARLSGQTLRYVGLEEFDFDEGRASLQLNGSLRTRTSVIAQAAVGAKRYVNPLMVETVVIERIPTTRAGRTRAQQRKKKGDPTPWTVERVIREETPGARLVQATASLRVAQSLGRGAGLAGQGLWRRHSGGEGRYLMFQESAYAQDDPLFDDPYTYGSREWLAEATLKLPWSLVFKAGWEWQDKRYDRPVFDDRGGAVPGTRRRDRHTDAWVSLNRPLGFGDVAVMVTLSSTHNRSNDPYYDYSSVAAGIGVSGSL